MNVEDLSVLKEGVLRRNRKGRWFLEIEGKSVPLDELLQPYKNKHVRLTCVDLEQAAHYLRELEHQKT